MNSGERRTVNQRGQVTLPKEIREQLGIEGGDKVVVCERDGSILIEKSVTRADLAEGYRRRAERMQELADEMEGTSAEANRQLGDSPDWK